MHCAFLPLFNSNLDFLQAVKGAKSGHYLLHDRASQGYGSIPGWASQTDLHACLQRLNTMQISLWRQPSVFQTGAKIYLNEKNIFGVRCTLIRRRMHWHSYNHTCIVLVPTWSIFCLTSWSSVKFILILWVDLVTEYNHGDMMWQPNTPTTPGKEFLSLDQEYSPNCV